MNGGDEFLMSAMQWFSYQLDADGEPTWVVALRDGMEIQVTTSSALDPDAQGGLLEALKDGLPVPETDVVLARRLGDLGLRLDGALEVIASHRFTERIDLTGDDIFIAVPESRRLPFAFPVLGAVNLLDCATACVAMSLNEGHLRVVLLDDLVVPGGELQGTTFPRFTALTVPHRFVGAFPKEACH